MTDTATSQRPTTASDTELETAAHQTIELLANVWDLIPRKTTTTGSDGSSKTKRFTFPAPWNTPAANIALDIHQAVRDHEQNLTLLLFNSARYRGTSDSNTIDAILRLPTLIRAAVINDLTDHQYVGDAVAALIGWPVRMRRFLDHDPEPGDPQPWTKAPGDLTCPHCEHRLWLAPGWQHHITSAAVYCRRCRDDNGRYLEWPASAWVAVLQHADTEVAE